MVVGSNDLPSVIKMSLSNRRKDASGVAVAKRLNQKTRTIPDKPESGREPQLGNETLDQNRNTETGPKPSPEIENEK